MLPRLPSSMHAGATTPADAARCTCRFSSRTTDGLPLIQGGSASALPVSRPAQRSLHVPACMVAELLNATLLSGVLQSMSLPPRTAPAATSRKRQLLGGIRTHQENAPFHGAPGHLKLGNGQRVKFVADPCAVPKVTSMCYRHPDGMTCSGTTWRQELVDYNRAPAGNQWHSSRAFCFVAHRVH